MENGAGILFLRIMNTASLPAAAALLCVAVFTSGQRKRGRMLFLTLSASVSLNCLLKAVFRIPRPWLMHPETAPLLAEGGFAFPCLHTQAAAAVLGALMLTSSKRSVRLLCGGGICAAAAVRLIAGVQSFADVLAGMVFGLLCAWGICRFLYKAKTAVSFRVTVTAVLLLSLCSAFICRDPWGPGLFFAAVFSLLPEKAFRKADPGRTVFGRFYGTAFAAGLYAVLIIFLPFLSEWLIQPLWAAEWTAVFLSCFLPCLLPVFPVF